MPTHLRTYFSISISHSLTQLRPKRQVSREDLEAPLLSVALVSCNRQRPPCSPMASWALRHAVAARASRADCATFCRTHGCVSSLALADCVAAANTLPVRLSVCLFLSLPHAWRLRASARPSVRPSVSLSVCGLRLHWQNRRRQQ